MTVEEMVKAVRSGQLLVGGEYRMHKAEILSWRDKTNGRQMEAPILRHTVEIGDASVAVNERVPDGAKLDDIKVPFTKGEAVVVHVSEWTVAKGLVSCRGRLESLTNGRSPGSLPDAPNAKSVRT